jgi:outer membrane receptor protein involved in Fe transport
MRKILSFSFAALMVLAFCALSAFAQSTTTGAIGVTATDPKGAVVPGATVTVRSIETNKEDTTTTDGEGRGRIVNLQPGNYVVTVTSTGFGTFTQDKVVVEVGRLTSLEVPLAVGQLQSAVEVTAEAPVIVTNQQDFSTNINQISINESPNNGRRWANFALGTPGAVADGAFGLISFRGISGLLNNNTIDGGDNNQAFFSEERGRTRSAYAISQAAIREYQVNTSNFSAEYGRSAGGVINAVTKSGTNSFHGGAFIYFRDERFNARNPSTFVASTTGPQPVKPEDNRKQFGGTIGGPIMKDKLFFFFSYDQQRRNFPGIAAPTSPTFFSTFCLTAPCAAAGTPGLTAAAPAGPGLTAAQANAALSVAIGLTGSVPRRGDQTLFLPKIDWHINDKHSLTFTYNRLHWVSPQGVQTGVSVTRGTHSFGSDLVDVNWGNLRLTSTLTPTVINEARLQIGRDFERQIAQEPGPGEPTTGVGGSSPQIALGTNGLTIGKPNSQNRIAQPDERRQQYVDTITMSRGNHVFKAGFDINRVSDLNFQLFNESGSYSYTNFNDFIVDYANFASGGTIRAVANARCVGSTRRPGQCYTQNSSSFGQGFGKPAFKFRTIDYAFFGQDDWRVTPKLTLNLGLRWEYEQLPSPQLPNATFDADTRFRGKTNNFPADKNNWGPRLGFAWDIKGDGTSSLRGGYGIYYGRITNSALNQVIANTGNPAGQFTVSSSTVIFPNVLPPPAGPTAVPNIVVFAPTMQNPQIHQTDLTYERVIAKNTVASIAFLGSWGNSLTQFVDVNLAPATQVTNFSVVGGPFNGQTVTVPKFTSRINTAFAVVTEIQPSVWTKYVGMVAQLNRRFTNNLQYSISYTLSTAHDNGQNSSTFSDLNDVFNPFDLGPEVGNSNFDTRHKFVASAVWHPDFVRKDNKVAHALFSGFNIAPILSITSGTPFSAGVSGSVAGSPSGGLTGSNGGNRFPLNGRNTFRQPKIWNLDMRVSRRFKFGESKALELLAEGFNVFNRSQIVNVNTTAYVLSGTTLTFQPTFQSTAFTSNFFIRERQLQFAARFEF